MRSSDCRRSRLPLLAILILGVAVFLKNAEAAPQTRLLVDLSAKPAPQGLSTFDLCVLRVDADVDLEAAHALGNVCLARVPLFDIAATSGAAILARDLGVPLLPSRDKGVLHLDATHPGWPQVVVHELVETAAERGFDGVVLCQMEQISQDAVREAVLKALALVKQAYPDKRLFIEGGYDLVSEARLSLDGILFMDSLDRDEDDDLRLARRLRECRRLGVQPYVTAFADPEKLTEVPPRAAWIREQGAVPFFTTPELEGVNLGPLEELSRRVLVLHSGPAQDCPTARVLQGALEWLGWQVIYQDPAAEASEGSDALPHHGSIQAVIFDATLQLNAERQHALAQMAVSLARQGVPLLLTGQPWEREADWATVCTALGIAGSGKPVTLTEPPSLRQVESSLLARPGGTAPRITGLRDVRCAAADSQVLLSLRAKDASAEDFDQVWIAPWGGVWLDPLAVEIGPQLDPLGFLEKWLARQPLMPVVDMTSLDGRRLLVTQVLADGFGNTAEQPGLPTAGEVMLEQVLRRYSLPMSVSLNEADVRGWSPGADVQQSERLLETSRAIFSLSHVEPMSAGLSRPTSWKGATPIGATLGSSAPPVSINLAREVAGSLAFLHRECLPQGRAMTAFTWAADSLPSAEAIAYARRMGVESLMTGAPASAPWAQPSGLQITPRSWTVGRERCALLPAAARPGAWRHAEADIARIQETGRQRWLAPAMVCFSFRDAVRARDITEISHLLDWCASQPFHAISGSQYARLLRDAQDTRIYQTGAGRWIIVNEGHARTLRLPASVGVPDLNRSTGVTGYAHQGDQLYIHTLGLRRTELVLRAEPEGSYLRLASATASVRYLQAGSSRAYFQVTHPRPVELAFEGIPPGTVCQVLANGTPDYHIADTQGRVEFTVPSQATVQLHLLPGQTAAMR